MTDSRQFNAEPLTRNSEEARPSDLKKALERGGLRENTEYQAAKERQSYVQVQLALLPKRLADLSMIDLCRIPTPEEQGRAETKGQERSGHASPQLDRRPLGC